MADEHEHVMSQFEQDLRDGRTRLNPEGDAYKTTSWAAVDLEPYKRGEIVIEPPRFLQRGDGRALIYPDRPHVFYGESESLKTWAALLACKSVLESGLRVVYVDLEGSEGSFVERCRLTGIVDGYIGGALTYIRPTEPLKGDATADFWLFELERVQPSLVVMDGVTELYGLQGWDINKAEDAAKYQHMFGFRGACASISIDHTSKAGGAGALGSQHKRAGLDGAEYEFESIIKGGRGREAVSSVRVTKDRHGYIREWASPAVGRLYVGPQGVHLDAPRLALVSPEDDAQDRILEWLQANPGSSTRAVRDGTGLDANKVSAALLALDEQGRARNTSTTQRHSWEVV
jgi:hypothetical protein